MSDASSVLPPPTLPLTYAVQHSGVTPDRTFGQPPGDRLRLYAPRPACAKRGDIGTAPGPPRPEGQVSTGGGSHGPDPRPGARRCPSQALWPADQAIHCPNSIDSEPAVLDHHS